MNRGLVWLAILAGVLGAATPSHAAWPPAGDSLSGSYPIRFITLFGDGSGGILPLWREQGNGIYRARAARVTSNGDEYPNWDWFGSSAWDYSRDSYSYPDGLGGAFFTYYGQWPDTTWKLLHVVPGGGLDPMWPSAGVPVSRVFTALQFDPWIQGDGTGGALVVYRSLKPTGSPGQPSESLLVRHVLANGTFDPAWPTGGLRINAPGQPPVQAGVTVRGIPDGAGGGIVVWLAGRVRAQRVTAAGTIAPGWPAGGLVLRDAAFGTTLEDFPLFNVLASGPDHFLAAWTDDSWSIWLQRFHRDGTLAAGWPTSGKLIYTYSSPGYYGNKNGQWIGDGSTGAYLAWIDWLGLRGVHVLEDGSIANGWSPGGLALTDPAAALLGSFDIANGAASGLVVTWQDGRNPGKSRLRTRWLLSDGTSDPNQPDSGRAVTPPGLTVDKPATMSDGHGGVYVGWADYTRLGPYYPMLSWVPYDPSLVGDPSLAGVGPSRQPRAIALKAWPNPARDALEVEFALATGSRARLELLDVSGRRVRAFETQGTGPHVAKLANLGDLAPGVYLLRLEQGDMIRTTRVALLH